MGEGNEGTEGIKCSSLSLLRNVTLPAPPTQPHLQSLRLLPLGLGRSPDWLVPHLIAMVTCRALPAGAKKHKQEFCSPHLSTPPLGSLRVFQGTPKCSGAATGWCLREAEGSGLTGGWTTSVTSGKRLGEGNNPREAGRETNPRSRKENQGQLGSASGGAEAPTGRCQPHPHREPEHRLPPPVPAPSWAPSPSASSVPEPPSLQGHNSWVGPCFWPTGPLVSALVAGREIEQHPAPSSNSLPFKPGIRPSSSSESPTNKNPPHLFILTKLFLEVPVRLKTLLRSVFFSPYKKSQSLMTQRSLCSARCPATAVRSSLNRKPPGLGKSHSRSHPDI